MQLSILVLLCLFNFVTTLDDPAYSIRGQCYKTFYGRNLQIFILSQSVCPSQAFSAQSNVDGESQEPTLECVSLGQATVLPANIKLGWKGLPTTNTLVQHENLYITAVISFITFATGVNVRTFYSSLWHSHKLLRSFRGRCALTAKD